VGRGVRYTPSCCSDPARSRCRRWVQGLKQQESQHVRQGRRGRVGQATGRVLTCRPVCHVGPALLTCHFMVLPEAGVQRLAILTQQAVQPAGQQR
jgi:hypothetical protein